MTEATAKSLVTLLRSFASVNALVTGVFLGKAKRSDELPYLIVNEIDAREVSRTNTGQTTEYLFQVSAFAGGPNGKTLAKTIAQAVYDSLNRYQGVAGSVTITQSMFQLRRMIEEPDKGPDGFIVHHAMSEYILTVWQGITPV